MIVFRMLQPHPIEKISFEKVKKYCLSKLLSSVSHCGWASPCTARNSLNGLRTWIRSTSPSLLWSDRPPYHLMQPVMLLVVNGTSDHGSRMVNGTNSDHYELLSYLLRYQTLCWSSCASGLPKSEMYRTTRFALKWIARPPKWPLCKS